ncbi:HAD-IC family P-type ATPase [Candidatus Dojkabacteria bacterium]|nr:HAD-IC family P-type ATPase [Candidatus Dojkabacteria bacterium]
MKKNWQNETSKNVFKILNTSPKGLSETEIKKRREEFGLNKLPEQKDKNILSIFLNQFKSPLIYILIFAGIVALFMHEYIDSGVIFLIIIINSLIGFYEEVKAERGIESLKKVSPQYSTVIRQGIEKRIKSEELVVGDILELNSGDKVGADARLFKAINLRTDESLLTGESVPVNKKTETADPDLHLFDAKNLAFSGTLVVDGRAKGIVVATGVNTQIGKIAHKVQTEIKEKTPLQKNLEKLGRTIGKISIVLVIPILILGLYQGRELFEIFEMSVSLAVSAIPEGLPIIITITLALGVNRMLKNNALIRRLPIVEVLGSTDVICTDKTGTVTTNQITVRKVHLKFQKYLFIEEVEDEACNIFSVSEYCEWEEDGKKSERCKINKPNKLHDFLKNSVLCCDATVDLGDPTEQALIFAAKKCGIDPVELRKQNKRIEEIPFSSDYKYMVTHIEDRGFIMKGAVEEVLKKCSYVRENGEVRPIENEEKEKILELNKKQAKNGFRVLGLALKDVSNSTKLIQNDLEGFVFIGLVSMIDPPRAEVADAIQSCYEAGIRVLMITGDHALTAETIAEEVGIESEGVLEGKHIQEMDDESLSEAVEKCSIYARVTSEDKLRILKALQRNGHVVGMGGDGVNDAPALKKAEVGFAVGSGTDLTKEVSDMVLLDDNFATIPKVIKEGRVIYSNIKNYLKLLLSSNFDEILVVLVSILMNLPLFFAPIHILWINLLSDGLPATALTLDQPDKEVMKEKPRDPKQSIISGIFPIIIVAGLIAFTMMLIVFSYEYTWWKSLTVNQNLPKARTMVFIAAVIFELVLVFVIRTKRFAFNGSMFKNKYLIYSVLSSLLLIIASVYIPILNTLFKTVPIQLDDWIFIISSVLSATGLIELFKLWYYKNRSF